MLYLGGDCIIWLFVELGLLVGCLRIDLREIEIGLKWVILLIYIDFLVFFLCILGKLFWGCLEFFWLKCGGLVGCCWWYVWRVMWWIFCEMVVFLLKVGRGLCLKSKCLIVYWYILFGWVFVWVICILVFWLVSFWLIMID